MNPELLEKALPLILRVLKEVMTGIEKGETPEEIRKRVASPDTILDEHVALLSSADTSLQDYVKTGK